MEGKHEAWVLATLNFLNGEGVQAYDGGWNANSLEGMERPKGGILEIPDRLKILSKAMAKMRSQEYVVIKLKQELAAAQREICDQRGVLERLARQPYRLAFKIFMKLRREAERRKKDDERRP